METKVKVIETIILISITFGQILASVHVNMSQ